MLTGDRPKGGPAVLLGCEHLADRGLWIDITTVVDHALRMNTHAITEAAEATLAGTMSFPDVVVKLIAAGVEYYHVDYVGLTKQFYDGAGGRVVTPIPLEDLSRVAPELDVAALRAAILDSQTKGQPWRDFSRRAMAAGVQSYFAFLRGQRVTYLGRTGDQHTEWFPGADPGK
jgi:uncharacterized protein YbcV (DUF1398 family)